MRALAHWALIAAITFLVVGAFAPKLTPSFDPPWDKLAHIVAFGTVTILAMVAASRRKYRNAALAALLVGTILVEIAQFLIPGSDPSMHDWIASAVGVALGFGCWILLVNVRFATLASLLPRSGRGDQT